MPNGRTALIGGRYELLNELGQGGTGTVYRALDRLTGRVVTLKTLHRDDARDRALASIGRFDLAREFSLLASLRHPNVIGVLDYGFQDADLPFFTMDLKEDAQTVVEAGHDQPLAVQVDLLVQTLRALAFVHRRGIVHRDVKPTNVLVVEGQVKLLDFGLSRYDVSSLSPAERAAGTIAYLAPEVIEGAAPGPPSDLYAFGVVMFEMMAGFHPFERGDRSTFLHRVLSRPAKLPTDGVDDRLRGIVARLLEKRPDRRFGDAGEVVAAMAAALDRPLEIETAAARESYLRAAVFTGRELETSQLREALSRAAAGAGATWLIAGESGVGKSRLLEEVRVLALVQGALVARGQASATGGKPYEVWRDVVRALVLGAASVPDRVASDLKPLVHDVDELLRRPVPDPASVEGDAAQTRLIVAVEDLIARQARPTTILLEDLQWAGSESLKMLATLARNTASRRLLIVGTYRDDERPEMTELVPDSERIRLERLGRDAVERLTESMIGSPSSDPRLIEFVLAETEGIPLFLVELLRSMAEEAGTLDRISLEKLPRQATSGGIRRLLRRRLSRVAKESRPLLDVAAVIGREIDLRLLGALAPDVDVPSWCAQCAVAGVFDATEDRFRFAHDKLREQVLTDLDDRQRRSLHRRVATAIEAVYPDSATFWSALAFHWGRCGERGREADSAEKAGLIALENGACAEAQAFFERALEILEDSSGAPDVRSASKARRWRRLIDPNLRVDASGPSFRRAKLEAGMTESCFRLGDFAACRLHALRAMRLCGVEMPASSAGLTLDIVGQAVRRLLQTAIRYRSNDEGAEAIGGEMVRVLAYLWEACFFSLESRAVVWSVIALGNHCGTLRPTSAMAKSHMAFALVAGAARLHPLAQRWSASAVDFGREVCSKSEYAYLLNRVNNYRFACCDWGTADREIAQAAEFAEEVGDRRAWEEARSMQGMSGLFQGRFEDGRRAWSEAQMSAQRSGNWQIECWGLMGQGDNLVRLGCDEEAGDLYRIAIDKFAGRAQTTERIWAFGMSSIAALNCGDESTAMTRADQALSLLEATRPVAYWTQFGTAAAAEVLLSLAERNIDRRSGQDLLRKGDRARAAMNAFARVFRLGLPFALLFDGWHAWLRGRRTRAVRRWTRCIAIAETLGTPYELGRAHFEMGRRLALDDPARERHVGQSLDVFRRCGARRDAARAESLLRGEDCAAPRFQVGA